MKEILKKSQSFNFLIRSEIPRFFSLNAIDEIIHDCRNEFLENLLYSDSSSEIAITFLGVCWQSDQSAQIIK